MSNFDQRKKLLAAESEVYRQLLKMEIQTFKVYGMRTKRRLTSMSNYLPWVMSGLPVLTGLFGRFGRKRAQRGLSWNRIGSLFLLGWKAYRRFGPSIGRSLPSRRYRPEQNAAEEYLANRL
jgi:hypothetical protein